MSSILTRTDPELVARVSADAVARSNPYVYGYGPKVPTRYWIDYAGRWRRVYVMIYGNSGSAYVIVNGRDMFLDIDTEHALQDIGA